MKISLGKLDVYSYVEVDGAKKKRRPAKSSNSSSGHSWKARLKELGSKIWKYPWAPSSRNNTTRTTAACRNGSYRQNWQDANPLKLATWDTTRTNPSCSMWTRSVLKAWRTPSFPLRLRVVGVFWSIFSIWSPGLRMGLMYCRGLPTLLSPLNCLRSPARSNLKNKKHKKNNDINQRLHT